MRLHNMNSDYKSRCMYCSAPVSGWTSHHHMGHHYKTTSCSCGKRLFVKLSFEGSGHDNWSQLEKKIRKTG